MPGAVHAAKNTATKADKNHRLAKPVKTAVRLPKHKGVEIIKGAPHTGKSNKIAAVEHKRLRTAQVGHHTRHNTRVRDVYAGKKHVIHTASNHTSRNHHHEGRVHSIIQTAPRESVIASAQEPMFLADHSRFAAHRTLAFQNPHTGDKLSLTYFEKGRYLTDALDEINFLLRDHRTDDVHPIDPALLDQLHDLKQMLGLMQPFDVICGYRSPLTNAKLHAEHAGVANNSFHMYGRAVDIRIERFDLRRIHNAAVAMHRGGVGYYPESNFIHLDTGTFRTWSL